MVGLGSCSCWPGCGRCTGGSGIIVCRRSGCSGCRRGERGGRDRGHGKRLGGHRGRPPTVGGLPACKRLRTRPRPTAALSPACASCWSCTRCSAPQRSSSFGPWPGAGAARTPKTQRSPTARQRSRTGRWVGPEHDHRRGRSEWLIFALVIFWTAFPEAPWSALSPAAGQTADSLQAWLRPQARRMA